LAHNSFKQATELAREGSTCPFGPNLDAFTVVLDYKLGDVNNSSEILVSKERPWLLLPEEFALFTSIKVNA
jgi:hypothetical protein